jgi:hypothetical protein
LAAVIWRLLAISSLSLQCNVTWHNAQTTEHQVAGRRPLLRRRTADHDGGTAAVVAGCQAADRRRRNELGPTKETLFFWEEVAKIYGLVHGPHGVDGPEYVIFDLFNEPRNESPGMSRFTTRRARTRLGGGITWPASRTEALAANVICAWLSLARRLTADRSLERPSMVTE